MVRRIWQWLIKHKEYWAVPLGMLCLTYAVLADLIWLPEGQFMGGSSQGNDFIFMRLPWWQFVVDSLQQGELPFWNPYVASGTPLIANPQVALFYPPMWLIGLLPLTRVVGVLFFLHLWIAGWGMYLWLRSEGASILGAWSGAAIFAFSGYFFVRICAGHSDVLMTQAWLPWILWACHKVITKPTWTRVAWASIPVGFSLLAGHTASFLYVALVWGTYALYKTWPMTASNPTVGFLTRLRKGFGSLLPFIGMGLGGFALAAVQLVPTFQFLALSTRQETSYTFASGYSWPPGYLLTLLVPNFFGNSGTMGYWGDGVYEELIFYVGILPLILALMALAHLGKQVDTSEAVKKETSLTPWLFGLALAGLLLALGHFSSAHRLAYTLIPLFRIARAPARAGFMFTVAVAALSGLTVTRLKNYPTKVLQKVTWRVAGWLVGGIASAIILTSFILFTLQRDSNPEVGRLWHVANNTALFLGFFLLSLALLSGWRERWFTPRHGAILAVGLILLDLWSFGRPLLQAVPVSASNFWQHTQALVQESSGQDYKGRILPWGLNIFDQNLGMSWKLKSVFSYDPLEIGRYHRFTTFIADPRARAYDLLGARYLAAPHEMDFPPHESASPQLVKQEGGVWLYKRPNVFPEAWLVHDVEIVKDPDALLQRLNDEVFDPSQTALLNEAPPCSLNSPNGPEQVQVLQRRNNSIELEVQTTANALLLLSEIAYPGWRISIKDQNNAQVTRVPPLRADYALRAVCIPAGTYQVVFSFLPTSLIWGASISIVTALTIIITGAKSLKDK